jgi:hypothetical protein
MKKQIRYPDDEKRRMILATMAKLPGLEFSWDDFFKQLHADYGEDGLSYSAVYGYMKREKLAAFVVGMPCRKLVRE